MTLAFTLFKPSAIAILAYPFRYPIKLDTLIFEGILTCICT